MLVIVAAMTGDAWKVVSVAIFGVTLVILYSVSTLYHSLRGRSKQVFRGLDHLSISLLIAGSYTPFCLVTLRGVWGWSLLGTVWGLAALSAVQEFWPITKSRVVAVMIYLLMGWAALAALVPLLRELGSTGFAWVAAGGLFYTIGIVFYALSKRVTHAHGVWHLFVLAGSATHYYAILRHVL